MEHDSLSMPASARWAALLVFGGTLFALGEIDGQRRAAQAHTDYITAQAGQTVKIGQAQTKVVVQTEIEYRDRIQKIYVKGDEIEKLVPVYVTPADDALCTVNTGFVRAYNAAWSGDDSGAAAGTDREPAGVPLSEVAEADVHNATSCLAWREQALGWRDYYRKLKDATARPSQQ